jgi:hypothetical protein
MMRRILLAAIAALCIISCNTKKDKEAEAAYKLYFDYRVVAEEGNDNLVATAQFRSEDGDALPLNPEATITLDGQPLQADSSKYTGYTYETYRAIDSFAGNHIFTYTNSEGEKTEAGFQFAAPQLVTALPDTIVRDSLELQFTGLPEKASVRIILIDTSFANEGLNQVERVENGRLVIPTSSFETVDNGPVQLELVLEAVKRLGNGTEGKVLIMYTLRREFFLRD